MDLLRNPSRGRLQLELFQLAVMPYLATTASATEMLPAPALRKHVSAALANWEAPATAAASAAFWMFVDDCTSFPISIARATKPNIAVSATVQRTRMAPASFSCARQPRRRLIPPNALAEHHHGPTTVSGIPLSHTLVVAPLFGSPL